MSVKARAVAIARREAVGSVAGPRLALVEAPLAHRGVRPVLFRRLLDRRLDLRLDGLGLGSLLGLADLDLDLLCRCAPRPRRLLGLRLGGQRLARLLDRREQLRPRDPLADGRDARLHLLADEL